jgi:hypothetical protein
MMQSALVRHLFRVDANGTQSAAVFTEAAADLDTAIANATVMLTLCVVAFVVVMRLL